MPFPVVALSAAVTPPAGAGLPSRVDVDDAYARALRLAGLVPVFVQPSLSPDEARAVVAAVSGVVLSGGEDLDPARYGALRHSATQTPHAGRDAAEIALVDAARAAGCPLFAICRGIQAVNVALGGTLVQDLPSELPSHIRHARDDAPRSRVHGIVVENGSRLAAAIGAGPIEVNSLHHQAIDVLASGLRVTARAVDGVIEAVESDSAWWVLAVQWHPEELVDDERPWDRALFASFARACGNA